MLGHMEQELQMNSIWHFLADLFYGYGWSNFKITLHVLSRIEQMNKCVCICERGEKEMLLGARYSLHGKGHANMAWEKARRYPMGMYCNWMWRYWCELMMLKICTEACLCAHVYYVCIFVYHVSIKIYRHICPVYFWEGQKTKSPCGHEHT